MAENVVMGAMVSCSQALVPTPMPFMTAPKGVPVMAGGPFAATIMDFVPMMNIPSFGMCNSSTNPAVIAATSAALGVHTPAPCVPATTAPWSPGSSKVKIGKFKALTKSDTCKCMWAGTISVKNPGQTKVKST